MPRTSLKTKIIILVLLALAVGVKFAFFSDKNMQIKANHDQQDSAFPR